MVQTVIHNSTDRSRRRDVTSVVCATLLPSSQTNCYLVKELHSRTLYLSAEIAPADVDKVSEE